MVNNRRSEIEIIGNILKLSINGAKKTELLYHGNFSYLQLQNYLYYLIDKGISEETMMKNNGNTSRCYKTTEKGFLFLNDIRTILEHLK